jgi:hypothetical protein
MYTRYYTLPSVHTHLKVAFSSFPFFACFNQYGTKQSQDLRFAQNSFATKFFSSQSQGELHSVITQSRRFRAAKCSKTELVGGLVGGIEEGSRERSGSLLL